MPGLISNPYYYVPASNGDIPQGALRAGQNSDGTPLYVARAFHKGDVVPGKVSHVFGQAFISYNCEEHAKKEYEVLCASPCNISWMKSRNGRTPSNAIPVGMTSYEEKLYLGRAMYNGSLTLGKIHPSHRCLYIPFEGREISIREYEVLVSHC